MLQIKLDKVEFRLVGVSVGLLQLTYGLSCTVTAHKMLLLWLSVLSK